MLNEYICIGRIVANPELRTTSKGDSYTNFNLAIARENSDKTDFPDFICFKKTAENLCTYIKKGDLISVVGSLRTRVVKNKKNTKINVTHIYYISNNKKTDINNFADGIKIPTE